MSMITKVLGQSYDKVMRFMDENIGSIISDHPNVRVLIVDNKLNKEFRDYPDESVSYVLLCVISQLVTLGVADPKILNEYWQARQNAQKALNTLTNIVSEK